jgi:hypothetical protein
MQSAICNLAMLKVKTEYRLLLTEYYLYRSKGPCALYFIYTDTYGC